MFIYKITNQINSKVYIGQSIRPIEQRFQRHISDAINNILDTHLARAIRKYGKDNFMIELIDIAITQDELNFKEQYWIRFYNSVFDGYNETDAIYKSGGNTYQSKTDEELNAIKEKIRQTKIGENNPNARAIKCFNVITQEELFFNTAFECQKYFQENTHRFITNRVTNTTKTLYKDVWKIAYVSNEYGEYLPKGHKKGTALKILNLTTNKEEIFESIRLASRCCGIPRNKINNHIKKHENEFVIEPYKITILN